MSNENPPHAGAAAHLDEVRELGALPGDTEAVLLVGSQARGWANPTSDYDFCVVTRSPYSDPSAAAVGVPLDPTTTAVREVEVSGRRCELAYWTVGQVDQLVDKVSWERFNSGEASLKTLVEVEETLLERLGSAVALQGQKWLQGMREDLDASAFRTFITTHSVSSADGKIEDIVGMLEVGDVESAVLAARLALDHMVDAMLDSRGVYGTRIPKWRMRRLRELPNPPLSRDRYWSFVTMADFDSADPVRWVDDVVAECQTLALEIDL